MKTRMLFPLVCFLSGCASIVYDGRQIASTEPLLDGPKARALVRQLHDQTKFIGPPGRESTPISFTRKGIGFHIMRSGDCMFTFPESEGVLVTNDSMLFDKSYIAHPPNQSASGCYGFIQWEDPEKARQFANAVRSLAVHSRQLETGSKQSLGPFQKVADEFRRAGNHEFPEEAQRYKAVAERELHDKNFLNAIDLYESALKSAPWWPEGHFNRALLLGQMEYYAEAAVEMRKYLMLAPHAPNATSAKEKIALWEGKLLY